MEYVVGWMSVKPGQRALFLDLAREFVEASRAEDGVLFFDLLPSADGVGIAVAIEGYASAEAHQSHVKSVHFAAFWELFQAYVVEGRFENVVARDVHTDIVRPGVGP